MLSLFFPRESLKISLKQGPCVRMALSFVDPFQGLIYLYRRSFKAWVVVIASTELRLNYKSLSGLNTRSWRSNPS